MQEIRFPTWEAFGEHVSTLEASRARTKGERQTHVSEILYRGQARSSWSLVTTLERSARKDVRLSEYYGLIFGIKPEIEGFTGRRWEIPEPTEYNQHLQRRKIPPGITQPVYEYMSHLRHHGFPSPLLDWTTSAYIAAYFAFKDAPGEREAVAIYAYLEYKGLGKGGWVSKPRITGLGPNVRTHARHFLQKCQYTICTRRDGTDEWYSSHGLAFARDDKDQDLLWKFIIPASERRKVLRLLERFNITSFSLFGSEESLMESLALREFLMKE